jgi:glyoxylase I family protein
VVVIERLAPAVPLLQVFDMQMSLRFYCDVIGFQVVDKTDHDWWAMLRLGSAELMLNTAYEDGERPASADPQRVRGHNDVSLYFDFPDLDGLHEHLRSKGCEVKPPAKTSYGLMQMNVKDPDGYELCFTAPLDAA